MRKYAELPWSVEDTIENLLEVKSILQQFALKENIDGKGEQDVKEIAFDFDRAIEALKATIEAGMKANTYQKLAARTINPTLSTREVRNHALHGMVGEIGEIHSLHQKVYQGHDLDEAHEKKEVGDLLWFIAEYCTANHWDMGEIMQLNIDKLKARFPDGFEADKSLHRKEGDI